VDHQLPKEQADLQIQAVVAVLETDITFLMGVPVVQELLSFAIQTLAQLQLAQV
jgi:hypothetical protein